MAEVFCRTRRADNEKAYYRAKNDLTDVRPVFVYFFYLREIITEKLTANLAQYQSRKQ